MDGQTQRNIHRNLATSVVASVLDALRNLVVASLLGPYTTGLLFTLMVIPQLTQYLSLGLVDALPLAIPFNRGRNRPEKVERLRSSVFGVTLVVSAAVLVLVLGYAAAIAPTDGKGAVFVALAAVLAVLWQLKQFFVTQYVAEANFVQLSRVELTFALTVCCAQILTVWWLRDYGFWIGLIAAYGAIVAYCGSDYVRRNRLTVFQGGLGETRELIPLGLVMLISSTTHTPFVILSRIFMAATVGVREVGFFILATLVLSRISLVSSSITRVILPKMALLYGREGDTARLFRLFLGAQVYTLGITAAIVAAGALVIEPVTAWALPAYLPGVPAATVILFAGIPYSAIENANSVLLSTQRTRTYTMNFLGALAMQVGALGYLFVRGTTSALSVAEAIAVVFVLYAVMTNIGLFRLYRTARGRQGAAVESAKEAALAKDGRV